jgi:hypothetical protein
MSVPRASRISVAAFIAAIVAVSAGAATGPSPVKSGPKSEVGPAASDDWFVWSQSRRRQVSPFDLYAKPVGGRTFRVNPRGTQAYAGGIDGNSLLYQLIRGQLADRSDLRLYDLAARRTRSLPAGINTSSWECCGTISGDWILFSRGHTFSGDRQLVVLKNLVTGEVRVLDTLRDKNSLLSAGQLNGTFAVWARCKPYPSCQVLRYDLSTGTATQLPVPAGRVPYSPSVSETGTAYYFVSKPGCGHSVQVVKQPVTGVAEMLFSLAGGRDSDVSFAHTLRPKPPGEVTTTRIYFDVVHCKTHKWDIYRFDDTTHVPPPTR